MARKYKFFIVGDATNATDVTEVAYNYSVKGKTLKQGEVGSAGDFTISFKTNKKQLNGVIKFEDLNASTAANFTSSGIQYSLTPGETSRFRASSKKSPQTFTYSFSLDNPVSPIPPPNPAANRIALTTFQDIYSDALGGQVIGGSFVDNGSRFTTGQDIVTSDAGTLGQSDDLRDNTSGDSDEIRIASDANNTIQLATATITAIRGIENIYITGSNDTSQEAYLGGGFTNISGVNNVIIEGTFTNQLRILGYLDSGARNFNFSGVRTGGINMTNGAGFTTDTAEAITVVGSFVDDVLQASLGEANIQGGAGADQITGSLQSSSTIAGQQGVDAITLRANNATDVVSLVNITSLLDADAITGFTGFNTNASNYDILRFNASAFTNYTANTAVRQATAAEAAAAAAVNGAQNYFIVDTLNNINATNVSQQGTAWLALDTTFGFLKYSPNGNFATNSITIATIDDFANFSAAQNVQIVA